MNFQNFPIILPEHYNFHYNFDFSFYLSWTTNFYSTKFPHSAIIIPCSLIYTPFQSKPFRTLFPLSAETVFLFWVSNY